MSHQTLYIIAGANGSGKTTFAKDFIKKNRLHFINADEIAASINPKNVKKAEIAAGRQFSEELEKQLKAMNSFVIESTLSGKTLSSKIKHAKHYGYHIKIIYLFLEDPKINQSRIKARVLANGHHIPDEDVIRRFYRSKINFWSIYKELCDSWELFYNADDHFQLIAMGTNQEYEIIDEILMQEFFKGVANVG